MLIILIFFGYLMLGSFTGYLVYCITKMVKPEIEEPISFLAGIFWPLVLPVLIGAGAVRIGIRIVKGKNRD